jgi:hypothetical protein
VLGGLVRERRALGASNLSAALASAVEQARTRAIRRVVLVTDGIATAGERDLASLRAAVLAASSTGIQRLDAIVPARAARDAKTLQWRVPAADKRGPHLGRAVEAEATRSGTSTTRRNTPCRQI